MKLPLTYYQNRDVVFLAKDLLGKVLFTNVNGEISAGIIVETEAYNGITDRASHAFGGRRTKRTEVMYHEGGVAYVYLCYGIHYFINLITSVKDEPHGILIRAIEPLLGKEIMERRRNMPITKKEISSGPGSTAKALGIDISMNKKSYIGDEIWIEDYNISYPETDIASVPRVGIDYAGEDALLPWRFFVKNNKYVSKPNKA